MEQETRHHLELEDRNLCTREDEVGVEIFTREKMRLGMRG